MELTQWILGGKDGLLIEEPMTALTDFLVTAVCILGLVKFSRHGELEKRQLRVFAWFFFFMGLGTLFAGLFTHAFSYIFVPERLSKEALSALEYNEKLSYNLHNLPNWVFNVVSVTLFEISNLIMIKKYLSKLNTAIYYSVIAVENLAVYVLLLTVLKYDIAIAHIGFALYLIALPLQIAVYKKYRSKYSRYMILGILIMLITPPVMALKFEFCKWFNFNDISHVVIAATMYCFMLAGEKFVEEKLEN
jgi:hypothetical protein